MKYQFSPRRIGEAGAGCSEVVGYNAARTQMSAFSRYPVAFIWKHYKIRDSLGYLRLQEEFYRLYKTVMN